MFFVDLKFYLIYWYVYFDIIDIIDIYFFDKRFNKHDII